MAENCTASAQYCDVTPKDRNLMSAQGDNDDNIRNHSVAVKNR